jgi:hypothetical protein
MHIVSGRTLVSYRQIIVDGTLAGLCPFSKSK